MESPWTNYTLRPSHVFLDQAKELTAEENQLIIKKLDVVKQNPFRYKSLRIPGLSKVFEIKITLQNRYCRIIYVLDGNEILVEGIILRKNDFKDLLPLLYKTRQERQETLE
ncbi:hypothetical protein HY994_02675 [Candidatus Micrarchaeota archaeon]|nr:hypothetical protein [Candidatus Micrarchaeota archaeon]